jgi:hypothetical protein
MIGGTIIGEARCNYYTRGYAINDCSKKVADLYKAGLPTGTKVTVSASGILEELTMHGLIKYRIYTTNAEVPLENGLTWIATVENDSEYLYKIEDSRLVLANLLGYSVANPDYAISHKSFQTLITNLLKDYQGEGPVTIVISKADLTMKITTPDGYYKNVRLNLKIGTGELTPI